MKRTLRNESGFALATAILALVVVGALVTAGFFAASQEARIGTSNAQADLAFYVAEQGLQNTLGTVRRGNMSSVAVGSALNRTGTVAMGARTVGNYAASVRPFGNNLYWVESLGTVTDGGRYAGAQRRVGMVVRTMNVDFPVHGALTSYGSITVQGNVTVSGTDTRPPAWPAADCPPTAPSEAGIYTRPEATVTEKGSVNISGNPRIEYDPNLQPEDFEELGDYDFDDFRDIATLVWSSGTARPAPSFTNGGTVCNLSDWQNWGDPGSTTSPCYSYFPILFHDGDLKLEGNGRGQGILLVDGHLQLAGNFEFYGVVIVSGHFNKSGGGTAEIHGALMTKNNATIDDASTVSGTPTIQYSRCSITRAIENNGALGRLFPIDRRSWVDLTGAGV